MKYKILPTAVWQYGGFRLNLKMVLYLKVQSLTESLGFLNPPHRQAAKRWQTAYENLSLNSSTEISIAFIKAFSKVSSPPVLISPSLKETVAEYSEL